jgi:putative ATP-dependent endonuclease of the OLD family
LARLYRSKVDTKGGIETAFDGLKEVVAITSELKRLGYTWKIKCTDIQKNTYSVEVQKRGKAFRLDQASSGERELLSYVFAIHGLGIGDALILVDEPELHLHPEWQGLLLDMFKRLAADTGNQFVLATHSPRLVTPASIEGVSRVYSDGDWSHIQRLDAVNLPARKHLFSIVNSQNNERIFFADAVLLVEGQSDRIFVEAALRELDLAYVGGVLEVVAVGGKTLFPVYQQLLDALQIKNFFIADRDYLKQVGSPEIKALFKTDLSKIRNDVVFNANSYDGEAIIREMDCAIASGDWTAPKELWEHIKSTRLGALENLSPVQSAALDSSIASHAVVGWFILKRGALEDYLPDGHKGKSVEKLIELTSKRGFWSELPSEPRAEFETILRSICGAK